MEPHHPPQIAALPPAASSATTNPYAFLERYPQWTPTAVTPDPEHPGKLKKVTVNRAGHHVSAVDPANWMTRAEAMTAGQKHHSFVLHAIPGSQTAIICFDFDNCLDAERKPNQVLQDIMTQLGPNVLWEVSVSGNGVHGWCWGVVPPHGKKNTALKIEAYSDLRHVVIGTYWFGSMEQPCEHIAAVLMRYFPANVGAAAVPQEGPVADWVGPEDDDELLRRAMRSTSGTGVFSGTAVNFADLWEANEPVLAKRWPNGNTYDASSADGALASHLAFWTGKDVARIERLMRRSALAREKWDNRPDYLVERTIVGACACGTAVLQDKPSAADAHREAEAAVVEQAHQNGFTIPTVTSIAATDSYATREDQLKLFAGCVLIVSNDGGDPVVLMPNGSRLRRRQFEAKFAGPDFLLGGAKNKSTDSAWEAFTRNQDVRFPRVDRPTFRPTDPFQSIYAGQGGETLVNVYLQRGEFKEGDASPFALHVGKILPRGDDALILTSYLAACVQYPGRKFPWAVVLVSGAEGTGKGLIGGVMATALGREYVKQPKASTLMSNFNAWQRDALLVIVNDMPANAPEALLEALKPMITDGEGATIEGKGADQISADVFCNWLFTSNHKDGIRKTANDRRYCMLFCAQDDADDLARDGMGEAYFTRFANWLQHEGGRAIAANYLKRFEIPERYDPTRGAVRAPATSSTAEALQAGRDELAQILVDNVADGSPGFRGDWISQTSLANYSSTMRVRPTPQKLKRTLESQGYVKCPGLPDGRTNNKVQPDNAKSPLWIKKGSRTLQSVHGKTAADIARMYEAAQAAEVTQVARVNLCTPNILGSHGRSEVQPAFGLQ